MAVTAEKLSTMSNTDANELADNMAVVAKLWQLAATKLSLGLMQHPQSGIGHTDPLHMTQSFMQLASHLASNPNQLMDAQVKWMKHHMDLWHRTTQSLLGKPVEDTSEIKDRRFRDESWDNNIFRTSLGSRS